MAMDLNVLNQATLRIPVNDPGAKRFFSDTVRVAREDAMSKVREDTPCTKKEPQRKRRAIANASFVRALLRLLKGEAVTGYDHMTEKPTR